MTCGTNYQKSTLKANATTQTLAATTGVLQLNSQRTTGCSISMISGSPALTKPGLYQVIFNTTVTSTGTDPVNIQLYRNGVPDITGTASTTPAASGVVESLGFSTIVDVSKSCCGGVEYIPLTFVNTGASAVYNTVSLTIVKLA